MRKGFSLIEVIVTVSIFAIVLVSLTFLIINIYRIYGFSFQQNTAINEARKGVETMVKEIRGARYGEDGSYPVKEAGNNQFIFYSDINRDERIERIRYFLDGINFKKGVIVPIGDPPQYVLNNEKISILSTYVRNASTPVFTYYNGDWPADTINNPLSTLTRLTETKLMHVYLQINVDPNRPPNNFQLESDVQIRNLKTNL